MKPEERVALVEELLHWPTHDLPGMAASALSVWWLRQLGILRMPPAPKLAVPVISK